MKLIPMVLVVALSLTAASGRAQTVTDAQIAAIVVAANQVDIDAGLLAESQASQENVKEFAWLMVVDDTGVNQQTTDLVTALTVTPQDTPMSQRLKTGGAFDQAYIAHEVTSHERVLTALDTTLIPNAQHVELKALLGEVRPTVVRHLAHAKRVQATLAE
jgi:putative membrane protein